MPYIYIMTNPAYQGYVKLGITSKDIEAKRKELSNQAGVMFDFEVYAVYETRGELQEKNFCKIIDKINPTLRETTKRGFYKMEPEEAYNFLMAIAEIAGDTDKVIKLAKNETANIFKDSKVKKEHFLFTKAQIEIGSYISFVQNEYIKAKVIDDKHIEYNGKKTTVSELARILLNSKYPVQGTLFFTYENETLNDRRERLESLGQYK